MVTNRHSKLMSFTFVGPLPHCEVALTDSLSSWDHHMRPRPKGPYQRAYQISTQIFWKPDTFLPWVLASLFEKWSSWMRATVCGHLSPPLVAEAWGTQAPATSWYAFLFLQREHSRMPHSHDNPEPRDVPRPEPAPQKLHQAQWGQAWPFQGFRQYFNFHFF